MIINLKSVIKPIFKNVASMPLSNPHHLQEIPLMVAGLKHVCIIRNSQLETNPNYSQDYNNHITQMNKMITDGRIIKLREQKLENDSVDVYALAEHVDKGLHLIQLYYDSKPLSNEEVVKGTILVGEILGYTQNDIQRCLIPHDSLYRNFLGHTEKLRRNIRKNYEKIYNEVLSI